MTPELRQFLRTTRHCPHICEARGKTAPRHTGYDANITRTQLQACAMVCKSCAEECERHADMHEHCRICAEACRRCERACADLLAALG